MNLTLRNLNILKTAFLASNKKKFKSTISINNCRNMSSSNNLIEMGKKASAYQAVDENIDHVSYYVFFTIIISFKYAFFSLQK